jgi:hypothetical protein
MANPNIVAVTLINGKTAVANVANTATELVVNTAGSNKVFKLNSLIISNIDGNTPTEVTIDIYRSNVAYHLAKTVTVPADASLDLLTKSIYLEEGDQLRVTGQFNNYLQAVCSYEEIS